jgi:hypothetical protein
VLCTNITWRTLAIDLSGPYANGDYLLVLMDYYSRFPEVEIIRSITSSTIINNRQQTSKIFSIHGYDNLIESYTILLSSFFFQS